MNKPYKKVITIMTTSEAEYEALYRYKQAKKEKYSYTFTFHIGKNNDIKATVAIHLK